MELFPPSLPPAWPLALDAPPEVVTLGVGRHGFVPIERYRIDLWSLHIYDYHATLIMNGQTLPLRPGSVTIAPAGAQLEYRYRGVSVHLYAHFRPVPGPATALLPALRQLGPEAAEFRGALAEAVGLLSSSRARAQARVWDLLWQLVALPASAGVPATGLPPAVEKVVHEIETRLGEVLAVPQLAAAVGLSHNHLTRLFGRHLGVTIAAYIRRRRIEKAMHLLEHTTLPIKSIAAQVGMSDLHAFNKAFRLVAGRAPRAWCARSAWGVA